MRNPSAFWKSPIREASTACSRWKNTSERLFEFLGREHQGVPSAVDLARFRRRQMLRIVLRDVLGVATLSDVTEGAFQSRRRHSRRHIPRHPRRFRDAPRRAASGRRSALRLFRDLAGQAGRAGAELQLRYRPDVRLRRQRRNRWRPRRSATRSSTRRSPTSTPRCSPPTPPTASATGWTCACGPMARWARSAISEEGARPITRERARDWEKQMLIKARVSAGEPEPGAALLEFVEPLIYQSSLDFRAVEAVSETRQRISEKMAAQARQRHGLDIKLMPGGIRDIEFLVQCLQRLHGGREPWVRHGGTMLALFRLRDKGLLSDGEYARLAAAYQFLRYLEHRLQMEEDRQTHTLPADPEAAGSAGAQDAGRSTGASTRPNGSPEARRAPRRRARDLRARDPRAEAAVLHGRAGGGIRCRGGGGRRTRQQPDALSGSARAPTGGGRGHRRTASRPRALRALSGEGVCQLPMSWHGSMAIPNLPPKCWTSSNTARTSPTTCCATRNCWRKSDSRSNSERFRWRMARSCAAFTAGRCCASRGRASWTRHPSSPRSARLRCWPTA